MTIYLENHCYFFYVIVNSKFVKINSNYYPNSINFKILTFKQNQYFCFIEIAIQIINCFH